MKRKHVEAVEGPVLIRKHVDLTTVTCGTDNFHLFDWNGQFYAETLEIFITFKQILPRIHVSQQRIKTFKTNMQNDSFKTTYDLMLGVVN